MNHLRKASCNRQSALNVLAAGFLILVCAGRAAAKPSFPPIFIETYHLAPNSPIALAANDCTLCHVAAGPPKRNPYGSDVRKALDAAGADMITPAILHTLDNKDSDGDGFSNLYEIEHGTLPGDKNSHPAGKPPTAVQPSSSDATSQTPSALTLIAKQFSLKNFLLDNSAQHPVLTHFPIGLFLFGFLLDLIAYRKKSVPLANAAYYNIMGAAITAPLAVITGIIAWFLRYQAAVHGLVFYHLLLGIATMIAIWIAATMRKSNSNAPTKAYLLFSIIVILLITVTGHLGGSVAGVN